MTNVGGVASGSPVVAVTGADAGDFNVTADTCTGNVLDPNESCNVTVVLGPTATIGALTASLDVSSTPGGGVNVSLSGTGIGPAILSVVPTSVAFGDVATGQTSAMQMFTVTNQTGAPTSGSLAVNRGGTDPAQFTITQDDCSLVTLGAGESCTVTVAFAPEALAQGTRR